jgi:hypothetical protein
VAQSEHQQQHQHQQQQQHPQLYTPLIERPYTSFKIVGTLDFGLIGILSKLTTALAEQGIPVFAVSTYETDYLLVKTEFEERAREVLGGVGGCRVIV